MSKSYDVYMCRARAVSMATTMKTEVLTYKLMCRICGADRTYEDNHRCVSVDPVTMEVKPYINAQTGTDKQIIRKTSWFQRIFR